MVGFIVCFAMLASKLNAASTYTFLENVEAGFGITSLQGSIHLGNIISRKGKSNPFQMGFILLTGCGEITHKK